MSLIQNQSNFDLKSVIIDSKLRGLWRLMTGFHLTYVWATLSMGLGALANTATFLLLRYFIDDYLGGKPTVGLLLILCGFLGLALLQGGFTFLSRTLAARTAEGSWSGCATICTTTYNGCRSPITTKPRRVI